jgi:NAD(P)-dependent dehydrogenase (short-subunit alcohol dehydrogenase family)
VNVGSIFSGVGAPHASAYAAAKHGVVGLTKSAALEYAARGIRINAVCPGFVETPMLLDRGLAIRENEEARAKVVARTPAERLGTPEEIAEAILWLSSDAASFITGHALFADGGYTAR